MLTRRSSGLQVDEGWLRGVAPQPPEQPEPEPTPTWLGRLTCGILPDLQRHELPKLGWAFYVAVNLFVLVTCGLLLGCDPNHCMRESCAEECGGIDRVDRGGGSLGCEPCRCTTEVP